MNCNDSHDNLVGNIVLKDIYIIKNTINDMVYIGQAKNTFERWKGHKTAAKTGHYKNKCILYEAMQKYGIDKFYYEILESQIPNYNEREKYWIAFYDCIAPHGYNILPGGEQYPNYKGIDSPTAAIKSKEVLDSIIDDLKQRDLRLTELASKYGVPLNTIHGINSGSTYFNKDIDYPIRKKKIPSKLSDDDVIRVIKHLRDRKETIKEISSIFGVSEETINCINIGQTHKDIYPQIKRPFRKVPVIKVKFTNEEIDKIIWYIQNTSLSYREIARRYNVEHNTILAIKNGRGAYRRPDLSYPLRPNN